MVLYWIARICNFICRRLPLWVCYCLAYLAAEIIYLAWPRVRTQLKENAAYILGSKDSKEGIGKIARQSLRNYCGYVVDFLRSPLLHPEDIEKRVMFQGWENLDDALEKGKGAILVSLHMGNWDIGAATIASRHYPLSAITDTINCTKLDQFVQRVRTERGINIIPVQQGIMKMVQTLRRNELLALLIDRPNQPKGVPVEFCSKPAEVPAGAATLAIRTGAKVIPCGLVRLPGNTFLGFINKPIPFQPSGNFVGDVQALTQSIMSSLEEIVKQYPDQWYMFRRIWV